MKRAFLTIIVAFLVAPVFAQSTAAPQKKAEDYIKFKETKFNFGKIKQGTPVTHDFDFSNISGGVVVIENATASCGCTTPKWPQQPITKGATDKITAGFNAATAGPFTKEIYVKIKGVDIPYPITITGEVVPSTDSAKKN
jgi:hypothetical protein